jgi:hypothetical protein
MELLGLSQSASSWEAGSVFCTECSNTHAPCPPGQDIQYMSYVEYLIKQFNQHGWAPYYWEEDIDLEM